MTKVVLAMTALTVMLLSSVSYAYISFCDGTFLDSDWSLSIETLGNGGAADATQSLAGGNPGAYRSTTVTVLSNGHVQTFHTRSDWSYDPGLAGAIVALDISLDKMSGCCATAVALRQGDSYYYTNGQQYYGGSWSNQTELNLTQNDFRTTYSDASHPDFTSSGLPIIWGFTIGNSAETGYTSTTGIDNLSISLHTASVPEPSSIVALLCGFGGLGILKWRRR